MNEPCFMGYKINKNIKYFLPNTILFSNENERITVSMVKDAVDYILDIIATQSPLTESYKTAKTERDKEQNARYAFLCTG